MRLGTDTTMQTIDLEAGFSVYSTASQSQPAEPTLAIFKLPAGRVCPR